MRRVKVEFLKEGMKLARPICNSEGRILLGEDVVLTPKYIERLKEIGITEVFIEDEYSEGIEIKDVISHKTREEARVFVRNLFDNIKFNKKIDAGEVKRVVNNLIDELLYNKDILINLSDIKMADDYTFNHSVNVCIYSLVIGINLGYDQIKLRDLGVGTLLHDIGKTKIPAELLKKPARLTEEEYELVKKHTVYGYEILKNVDCISSVSAYIALCHHERFDGRGYPLGISGQDIHRFARISSVADVYDALTSDRVYKEKIKPEQAVEYLVSMSNYQFDCEIVKVFLDCIAIYPIGTGVILNTGEKGIVVDNNKNWPTRPVVRIVIDERGRRLSKFKEIDLSKDPKIFIESTCDL